VPEDWWYFPVVARLHGERTGYPTQKPEALVERIVKASSNAGDVVADFFCGSGTLPAVAERLGRAWLACDASPRAIHTATKRLLGVTGCAPFEVWSASQEHATHECVNVQLDHTGCTLQVTLRKYQAAVPDDLRVRVHSFEDLVDYWEIDPDFRGGVFCSRWQSFRSRAQPELVTQAKFDVDGRKGRKIAVRVVDVLGRATTVTIPN